MPAKRFIDKPGFKTCLSCEVTYVSSSENFSKNIVSYDKLCTYCKKCDNKRRAENEKNRKYHNVPRRCTVCDSFFWASRANMNKVQKTSYKSGGIFCSKKCHTTTNTPRGFNRKGKSWNGKREGENNPNTKYNTKIIIIAKTLMKEGKKCKDISKETGIPIRYLYHIKKGRAWASVTV